MKHDFRAGWSSVIARVVAGWSPEEGDLKSLQGVKEAGKLSSSYIVTRDLNLQFEFAVEQSSQPPSDTAHAPLEGRCWVPVPTWIFFWLIPHSVSHESPVKAWPAWLQNLDDMVILQSPWSLMEGPIIMHTDFPSFLRVCDPMYDCGT